MFAMLLCILLFGRFFFFFKQKTAYEMRISDWSSDVCSSDLMQHGQFRRRRPVGPQHVEETVFRVVRILHAAKPVKADFERRSRSSDVGGAGEKAATVDRKSTRLNSSH